MLKQGAGMGILSTTPPSLHSFPPPRGYREGVNRANETSTRMYGSLSPASDSMLVVADSRTQQRFLGMVVLGMKASHRSKEARELQQ